MGVVILSYVSSLSREEQLVGQIADGLFHGIPLGVVEVIMGTLYDHGPSRADVTCAKDSPKDKVNIFFDNAWDVDMERHFANNFSLEELSGEDFSEAKSGNQGTKTNDEVS